MLLYSFAKNASYDRNIQQLFESIGNHIVAQRQLDDFTPQELSNIVWAFAKIDYHHKDLFESIGNHIIAQRQLDDFAPQALSNIVWAFAKIDYHHKDLFETVANHIIGHIVLVANYNEQVIAMIIWAFSKSRSFHVELFELLTDHILQRDDLDDFTFISLNNIVWGLNQFTTPPKELMEKVLNAASKHNDLGNLARLAKKMFPDTKEICWDQSCTTCGRHHINDIKLMEVLLQRRLERMYEEQKGMLML